MLEVTFKIRNRNLQAAFKPTILQDVAGLKEITHYNLSTVMSMLTNVTVYLITDNHPVHYDKVPKYH